VTWGKTTVIGLAMCALAACTATPSPPPTTTVSQQQETPQPVPEEVQKLASQKPVQPNVAHLDHSGRKQIGHASYYAQRFAHRKMANGEHLDPDSNVIASRTLPIGTTVRVTNKANGKSAVVTVADRGPYVKGRVVDLTPKVADELDLTKVGVAPVVVAPIAVPQVDGGVKLGAGAADASPHEIEQATQQAEAARR
jgi:rare lipoprotein A